MSELHDILWTLCRKLPSDSNFPTSDCSAAKPDTKHKRSNDQKLMAFIGGAIMSSPARAGKRL